MGNQKILDGNLGNLFQKPYEKPLEIKEEKGNNFFSYQKRKNSGSDCVLVVPSLIEGTIDDLHIGKTICFEEYENGKLFSCVGLETMVRFDFQGKKVIIMDNHNHALFFRIEARTDGIFQKGVSVIHIDQHSDMTEPEIFFELKDDVFQGENQKKNFLNYVFGYVNSFLNIGNFLVPALKSGLISQIIQVRSQYALTELEKKIDLGFFQDTYILDIDLDFWVEQMGIDEEQSLKIVRKLFDRAVLVTIATSPYFIDQSKAIELVKKIFS